jgi:hypothetical protein
MQRRCRWSQLATLKNLKMTSFASVKKLPTRWIHISSVTRGSNAFANPVWDGNYGVVEVGTYLEDRPEER